MILVLVPLPTHHSPLTTHYINSNAHQQTRSYLPLVVSLCYSADQEIQYAREDAARFLQSCRWYYPVVIRQTAILLRVKKKISSLQTHGLEMHQFQWILFAQPLNHQTVFL